MYTNITMNGLEAGPDMADKRGLNPRKSQRANNTKAPRTRDGQAYPGGKTMRKALERLASRRTGTPGQTKAGHKLHVPGSRTK